MSSHFLYGLVELSFWGYAAVVFATVQLMFLGITLYLHRDQAHGGLVLHPVLRHLFRFWLWFSSGTNTRQWVAVHRRHHAFSDQEGDPHSPVVFGLKRVVFEGYELYVAAARDPEIQEYYGRGTPDDWIERNVYSRHPVLGIVLFSITMLVLFGIPAIAMVGFHLIAQPFFAAGIINGVGHAIGYRSFEMPSTATNIVPWGLIIAGEELHNNHHAFPRSARFSIQPWEIDVGWFFIRIFQALGLAEVKHVAPSPRIERQRHVLDAATVQALFTNRMHVLRDYGRRVISPVCREVAQDEGAPANKLRRWLVRHPQLLGQDARQAVDDALAKHESLRAVVEFRDRLQELWNEKAANPTRAVQYLREWCAEAEASGIRALHDFALYLRSYVPATPARAG